MGRVGDAITGMSGRKGKLLILAAICVAVGFALNADRYFGSERHIEEKVSSSNIALKNDWAEGPKAKEVVKERAHTWGDAAIRFGGSFMIALIIGALLRAFVRTMIIAILVGGIVFWYLNSRGIAEPFWDDAFESWDHAKGWGMAQTESVKQFFQGYVPSMTAALIGFGFGLKK